MRRLWLIGMIGYLALWLASALVAQPFTYQGFLKQNGQPVNGTIVMTFTLYDAVTGSPIPPSITRSVSVQNGLFTVALDFGAVWTGADRYLEIQVGSTTLSPRVKVAATPYAINALYSMKPWEPNGSAIFYNGGNVGIGTSSPAVRLSLGGDNANTKLALWQGSNAGEVMGFGIGPNQFRLHLHHPGNRFSFLSAPNGSELVTIKGDGKVGIGTSSPEERLDLQGNLRMTGEIQNRGWIILHPDVDNAGGDNNVHIKNSALTVGGYWFSLGGGDNPFGDRRVSAQVEWRDGINGGWVGSIAIWGGNGSRNVTLGYPASNGTLFPSHGALWVYGAAGNFQAGMYVNHDGRGIVWGDSKSFRVPDPEDATRDIWYGCIEGPELAMYVRGTARLVNGRARVELPDHFRKLADEQGMTVQLTPLSPESRGLCVVRKGLDGIEVVELLDGRGNYEFDWRVEAVRKEHRDFEVYRPWDHVLPGGMDRSEAWEARIKSIQARQARQRTQSQARATEGGKAR